MLKLKVCHVHVFSRIRECYCDCRCQSDHYFKRRGSVLIFVMSHENCNYMKLFLECDVFVLQLEY